MNPNALYPHPDANSSSLAYLNAPHRAPNQTKRPTLLSIRHLRNSATAPTLSARH